MMKTSTRKLLIGTLVLALVAVAGSVAFAQDEESAESNACDGQHHGFGYDYDSPLDALAELDLTIAELRDHLASGGTISELLQQELLQESGLMEQRQERRLACIAELEANNDLTAAQANALRAVIETGADQAMREVMGSRVRGKGGHFSWSHRGGRSGHGFDARRAFSGRDMPGTIIIPDLFRSLPGSIPFEGLDELFADLAESGSLDETMRERLEQLEEALRSGSRSFFRFRIDRDDDGQWQFNWFGPDEEEAVEPQDEDAEDSDADENPST
ncbi:MAG: hypothetical protein OXF83_05785 [Anaerolineaceae bacterium]|nr:hypothetical protein [Anaerolineaceae bacterium]